MNVLLKHRALNSIQLFMLNSALCSKDTEKGVIYLTKSDSAVQRQQRSTIRAQYKKFMSCGSVHHRKGNGRSQRT